MIDYEEIKKIGAIKGVSDIIIEKDYILDWILWGVSQDKYLSERIVFKGGTALHKMYFANWRFSEDLDFTTISRIEESELEKALTILCNNIKNQSGIEVHLRNIEAPAIKDDKDNIEWSCETNIEYIGPRRQIGGKLPIVRIHITNDELLLDKSISKFLIAQSNDLPSNFALLTYSLEEIIAEKMRTVLHQRCWPRDIYDLWRLLHETISFIDIEKAIDIYHRKSFYRMKEPGIPINIDERIMRIKNQWKESIQRQISNAPDFDIVYPDIIVQIGNIFENYNKIKGGTIMLETHYVMRYKNGEFEIEVQGDKEFVEKKFEELLKPKPAIVLQKEVTAVSELSQKENDRKESLSEFLKAKNPKSHGDKILLIGYYMEKIEGETQFNIHDIEKCYAQARMPKTKNFGPYITQLVHNGYIMDAEEKKNNKKAWIITESGLKHIEELSTENIPK